MMVENDGGLPGIEAQRAGVLPVLPEFCVHNEGPGGCVPWEEAVQLRNALEHIAMNLRGKKHLTETECKLVHDLAQAALPLRAEECDHEWVSMRNEVIESGEMCAKCRLVRAKETHGT